MKPRKPLNKVSKRKRKADAEYAKTKRIWWNVLVAEHGPWVPCVFVFCKRPADKSPHHVYGRLGALLCDARFWKPVCWWHHAWIHDHPNKARKLKMLAPIGQWNKAQP